MPNLLSEIEVKTELSQSLSEESSTLHTEQRGTAYFSITSRKICIPSVYENSIFLTAVDNEGLVNNSTTRKGMTESFTQPSRNSFIKQKLDELYQVYLMLGYENEAVLEIGSDLIKDCLIQEKLDIKISRTGENELLIFRDYEGTFNNLIIDEDADIEYLHIPVNRTDTFNEHYSFIDNLDTFALASKL